MTREERRAAMPLVSEFIDDIRKHFGEDSINAINATENGQTIKWRKTNAKESAAKSN